MPGTINKHPTPSDSRGLNDEDEIPPALAKEKGILNTIDRISEILYGLIIVLSFTCTISVAETGGAEIKSLLIAAIGSSISWGIVDAVMYVMTNLF